MDREHNQYGAPFVKPDPQRERWARVAMTQPAFVMSPPEREIVCQAFVELAKERGWQLWAAHVRSNHVHVVLSGEGNPDRIMSDLKGRASKNLNNAGFDSAERKRWTRHGSTRLLFSEEKVEERIRYTLDEQGTRMAWYEEPRMK